MVIFKIQNTWARLIHALTYALLVASIMTKLICIPYIHDKFYALGINEFCRFFGTIELIAVIIFMYSRTIGLGFVLLCCYFGGAIATDLNAPEYLYQPLLVIVLTFITSFLRKPSIFYDGLSKVKRDHYNFIECNAR